MRRANVRLFASYHGMLTGILEEGVAKGIFTIAEMKYTVTVIISMMQGIITYYIIDNSALDYARYTEKLIGDVVAMVTHR